MFFKDLVRKRNYSALLSFFLLFSCSKEKIEADIPAYIFIDEIAFSTNSLEEGSNSEEITDAWVYIDDQLVGVYELPITFPILREGNVELKVYAGIKDNGIAASRARYLFYLPHEERVNLVEGEETAIKPLVTYHPSTKFSWMENFEQPGISFSYSTGSDTTINRSADGVFEGDRSGQIYLEEGMNFFEANSIPISDVPTNGAPVYLEMDFKTNQPILVGVIVNNEKVAHLWLNTTSEWKKIYVNLTNVVKRAFTGSDIQVFFGLENTVLNPFIVSKPEVYMDNIKLIHF